jgi:hypothetical protein
MICQDIRGLAQQVPHSARDSVGAVRASTRETSGRARARRRGFWLIQYTPYTCSTGFRMERVQCVALSSLLVEDPFHGCCTQQLDNLGSWGWEAKVHDMEMRTCFDLSTTLFAHRSPNHLHLCGCAKPTLPYFVRIRVTTTA